MRLKLLLVFFLISVIIPAQIKIGFIDSNNSAENNSEIKAAFDFLKAQKEFSVRNSQSPA